MMTIRAVKAPTSVPLVVRSSLWLSARPP